MSITSRLKHDQGTFRAGDIVDAAKEETLVEAGAMEQVWNGLRPYYVSKGADRLYLATEKIKKLFVDLGGDIDNLKKVLTESGLILDEVTREQLTQAESLAALENMQAGDNPNKYVYSINR